MTLIDRRFFLAAIGATACASGGAQAPSSSLSQVLSRHAQARGGADTLDAVYNTLNVAEVIEPTFSVIGRYIASTDGLMRVDVFYDGARVFSEGIDADGGWDWESDAETPRAASARGVAALAHGIEFNVFGLHALPRRGHTLTYEGRETLSGMSYHKIKVTLVDGFETWRFINPETWLIDRARDVRALHPDVDPTLTTIESEYADHRPVSGVLTAFRWIQRNADTGAEMQRGAVHRLEYNVATEAFNFPRGAMVIAP